MFDEKARAYEEIQSKIEANHRFMDQHYILMQKKMNSKYELIKAEKDKWEAEKEEIRNLTKVDMEIVNLNIGGTHHLSTDKKVL